MEMRVGYALLVLALTLPHFPARAADKPQFVEKHANRELLVQLRKGGYVLYMRHGPTDMSRVDRVPKVDLNDCSTQRPLSEEGRKVAAKVGDYIRKARIPVGEMLISPMCRTRQTAEAAFKGVFIFDENLLYTANLTDEEKRPKVATTLRLLAAPVADSTNRVIVAHAPNLMDAMGYFVKPEAAVVIIRPLGDKGFEYLATIAPDEWPALLK